MAGASIELHSKAKAQGFSARFVLLKGKTVKLSRGAEDYGKLLRSAAEVASGRKNPNPDLHPIRLQLIHNLKVKRFTTGEACTLKEWDAETGRMKPGTKSAGKVNRNLNALEAEVVGIVDALVVHGTLSLDAFESRYRNPKASGNVLAYMEGLATKFTKEGRIGYAGTFRTAAAALGRLTKGKPIRFADLTTSKLEELERLLKEEGNTGGGIAAYMRTLRVAINTAIKEGHMAPDQYPFETATHPGYSMKRLKSTAKRRALDASDMDKLKRFPFDEAPHLAESVRYFLFSYYADGMNFQDMARLKRESLRDGRIFYARKKTGREINIPVDEVLSGILAAFDHDGPYLFPILGAEHATEMQQWNRIRKCLKRVNADLKEAAKVVGIRTPLTTYVARHTAFTTLYRSGVALEEIAELARHSSPAVTQNYLLGLGCDVLDEARKKLR